MLVYKKAIESKSRKIRLALTDAWKHHVIFLQSLTKDLSLEKFKIILQATDLPALTRSDPVSLIEDILMAASEGDKN